MHIRTKKVLKKADYYLLNVFTGLGITILEGKEGMSARNSGPLLPQEQEGGVSTTTTTMNRGGGSNNDDMHLSMPFIPLAIGVGVVFPGLLTILFAYIGYRR